MRCTPEELRYIQIQIPVPTLRGFLLWFEKVFTRDWIADALLAFCSLLLFVWILAALHRPFTHPRVPAPSVCTHAPLVVPVLQPR